MLPLLLAFLLCTTPALADIPSVANISVNNNNYQVTELLEYHKNWLHPSKSTWRYKLLDSDFTLVIHSKDYYNNKKLLKTVPDYRDFYTRHPYIQKIMLGSELTSVALNILTLIRI